MAPTTIRSAHTGEGPDPEWLVNQIAHALRNPIFAALVQAEALVLKAADRPDLSKSATMIHGQLKRLEGNIDEMLLLGRPAKLNIRQVDLRPVAVGIAESFRAGLHGEAADVTLHMDDGPMEITSDPDAVQRILERLVQNAVQHTDSPHAIDLEVIRTSDDTVCLSVSDRGHGIGPELLDQVFMPFYPQHAGRPGLGLSVAAKFAHVLGGHIELETEKDEGTIARVYLAAEAKPVEA
jgi:two-component system, sporulation sensor kinase E